MPRPLGEIARAFAGRYRVQRELGRGGMATVYEAEDLRHSRTVAIKVLEPEVAAAVGADRFLREIQLTARLTHPHIVPLFDSGEVDGLLYFVMPRIDGESLRARLSRDHQLPLDDALRITREIAGALAYAHAQGLVHRDVKPENILLTAGGALLADFGIARGLGLGATPLTSTGVVVGTPGYMSPEQVMGSATIDGRSDQYALACLAYEMLAGQPPFTGPTVESVAHQHLSLTPRPVTDIRPMVPVAVSDAIARALAKTPADRFASIEAFAAALGGSATEKGRDRPTARQVVVAIGALAVIVAIVLGIRQWFFPAHARSALAPGTGPAWVLVAEFEGPSSDPELAPAARQMVSAALDQSGVIATVPRSDVLIALKAAGKPDSTRITPEIAREIAYRRSVRAMLEGSVQPIGAGYAVAVRLWDVERDSLLLTERAAARSKDDLIPSIDRMARRLRAAIGESRAAIHATRELAVLQTPSFEALRLHLEGGRLANSGDYTAAFDCWRRALRLDPDFAPALDIMTIWFANLGMADSMRVYMDRAAKVTGRRSESLQLGFDAFRVEGNAATLEAWGKLVRQSPNGVGARNNYAVALSNLGRHEEAAAQFRTSIALRPFGPGVPVLFNLFTELVALGRMNEAEAVIDSIHTLERPLHDDTELCWLILAAASERWRTADSLGGRMEGETDLRPQTRIWAAFARAAAQSARGKLRAVASHLTTASLASAEAGDKPDLQTALRSRAVLFVMAPWLAGPVSPRPDSSLSWSITLGFQRAAVGRWAGVESSLVRVRAERPRALLIAGDAPAMLEALAAAHDGRWTHVVDLLSGPAHRGYEDAFYVGIGTRNVRWQLARAFEATGRLDSALVYDSLAIAPYAFNADWSPAVGRPLVQLRIIANALRCGRVDLAERTWTQLSREADHPDPELAALMQEERRALDSALMMSKAARR